MFSLMQVHLGGDHFQNVLKTRYRISNFIIGNTAQFETDAYWLFLDHWTYF